MPATDVSTGRPSRQPRGFALAAAMFALVIIAALVTGGFFAARQEMRIGLNSRTSLRAFSAAEAGVNTTIANWSTGSWNNMTVGDSATVSGSLGSGVGASSYSGSVRRLNTQLFLIRVTGIDQANSAQRTLAALTRLQLINMNFRAALTVRGSTSIGGSSLLDGRDTPISGWGCPTTGLDTLPGIVIPSTSGSSIDLGNIQGDPKVVQDPTINDSTFFKYGDLDWNELIAMATKVYPSGDVGPLNSIAPVGNTTTCTTASLNNWGDPHHAAGTAGCWSYFPIIYVNGNLKLTGGYGQGILLVSGDLEISGGAEFYGPAIIRGHLKSTGTGGHFNGGVMAANVDMESNTILGNSLISYSSCALSTALAFNAPGRMVKERSWAEVF